MEASTRDSRITFVRCDRYGFELKPGDPAPDGAYELLALTSCYARWIPGRWRNGHRVKPRWVLRSLGFGKEIAITGSADIAEWHRAVAKILLEREAAVGTARTDFCS
jgi:hypothetical protein